MSKIAGKITLDPHIQHTPYLNCYHLIDATELWAPERPDTETVSSLRQSSHEHLTIITTHTIYTRIYLTHILSQHFNCTYYSCTYKIVHRYIPVHKIVNVYIVIPYLLVLFNSYLYYLCFYSVTVILLHCGSFCHENKFLVCVNIPGNKAHSDSDSDAAVVCQ